MRVALPLLVGTLGFVARFAVAQEPAGRVVSGVVFDSVAGKPLAGATVQLAVAGATAAPRTVITDATGAYRLESISAGQYVLGFYHDALTALGLDAPTRAVEVRDTEIAADLAIPSSATIRALRCGDAPAFAPGMLVGFVRDAQSNTAVPSATAVVYWRAIALDSGDYRVVTERRTGTVESDGSLLVCHLPVDAPLNLLVTAPGHRNVDGAVLMVPAAGIATLDIRLADTALTTGTGIIRGQVARESGRSVTTGRVLIKALNRTVPIVSGAFTAAGLPSGTWVAQAQVIGVEPQEALVSATESEVASTTITVSNGPQRLDAVTVVGKMDRNLTVLDDVLRRSRIGMGTTFLPGHPALRSATFVSDVMREARGFQYSGPNRIVGRVTGDGKRCLNVATYVDDVRQPEGFTWLDHAVRIKDILAIETWPDIRLAPVQYRHAIPATIMGPKPKLTPLPEPQRPEAPACALVLVWTRRSF